MSQGLNCQVAHSEIVEILVPHAFDLDIEDFRDDPALDAPDNTVLQREGIIAEPVETVAPHVAAVGHLDLARRASQWWKVPCEVCRRQGPTMPGAILARDTFWQRRAAGLPAKTPRSGRNEA